MRRWKRTVLPFAAALLLVGGSVATASIVQAKKAEAARPWMDAAQTPEQRADELLAAMTQAEKLTMMHGGASCGYVGCVDGNTRLGIPAAAPAGRAGRRR